MKTTTHNQYDVIIVGASVAGSTAAIFYAEAGLRVALIERSQDIDAYKKACTHYLQAQAYPILKRLGMTNAIEEAGGVRNGGYAWTKYGWIGDGVNPRRYGYNIRRELLDPLLRRKANDTPGVDLHLGTSMHGILQENGRFTGIQARQGRQEITLYANLIVGADGRYSRTAELANVPTKTFENNRFCYFAYYRNLPLASGRGGQTWFQDDTIAYAMPNDHDLTMVAVMKPKKELKAFKANLEENFEQFFLNLPSAPAIHEAERTTKILGMLDAPMVSRKTAVSGLALIGDAALASDPVWGNGMSWAFQAADWLVKATHKTLAAQDIEAIDASLQKYEQKHHDRLGERFARDVDFARGRSLNWLERLFYSAAVHEPKLARYTGPYSTRLNESRTWPPLTAIKEAVLVNLKPHQEFGWPTMPAGLQATG
jgi:2-polyprenyl-6-methoxyphenol hydroxylase-like FAD-dependent oxidoreductase